MEQVSQRSRADLRFSRLDRIKALSSVESDLTADHVLSRDGLEVT